MTPPRWTPVEAAYHLGEAFAAQHGEDDRDTDPVTLEDLARALDADPEYLEASWEAWHEGMSDNTSWTEGEIDDARYWLDTVVVGGLANP